MSKHNFTRRILITGANRGMGLGYVVHYLRQGGFVVATARNLSNTDALAQLQNEYLGALLVLKLDVGSESSISEFVKQLEERKLTFSLVINNAGISVEEKFGHWTMANFEQHFRVNTLGPAMISQALFPFLTKTSRLVQISSGMGSLALNINPEIGLDAYAASKCALHNISIRMAEKVRPKGIGVFIINPGWVKTDMGGPEAPSTVERAIKDITNTIAQLKLEQTGSFFSEKGEIIPW